MTAGWRVSLEDDLIAEGIGNSLAEAWDLALDVLFKTGRVHYSYLSDDEAFVVDGVYVNPTVKYVRDFLVETWVEPEPAFTAEQFDKALRDIAMSDLDHDARIQAYIAAARSVQS